MSNDRRRGVGLMLEGLVAESAQLDRHLSKLIELPSVEIGERTGL